jgi:hypothetical protein
LVHLLLAFTFSFALFFHAFHFLLLAHVHELLDLLVGYVNVVITLTVVLHFILLSLSISVELLVVFHHTFFIFIKLLFDMLTVHLVSELFVNNLLFTLAIEFYLLVIMLVHFTVVAFSFVFLTVHVHVSV